MSCSTPPVLRVKRRRNEDPAEALLVHASLSKRAKKSASDPPEDESPASSSSSSATATVSFRFAGTLSTPEHSKKDLDRFRTNPKSSFQNILEEDRKTAARRKSAQKLSEKNRYKVVKSFRVDLEEEETKVAQELYQLYDVIKEESNIKKEDSKSAAAVTASGDTNDVITCNGIVGSVVKVAEDDDDYVYDFYYPKMDESFDLEAVHAIESLDALMNYRDGDSSDDHDDYDEDSNDENNWRNEYPDEDDFDDEEADDYGDDFGFGARLKINKADSESLSDDEDEDVEDDELVYSKTFDNIDADLHGTSYAKYKHRMLRDEYDDDDDELDEYDYPDDD